MNGDGSAPGRVPVTGSDSYGGPKPAWSPDGGQIVFMQEAENDFELWKADALTCDAIPCPAITPVQLTHDLAGRLGVHTDPAWSPDGRTIAFVRDGAINLMGSDGSRIRQLTYGGAPAWSPDGRWIAFTCRLPDTPADNNEICVVRRDGHGLRKLTTPGNDRQPIWSADGWQIFFLSDREGYWAIHAMHRDGSEQHRVVDLEVLEFDASWTP